MKSKGLKRRAIRRKAGSKPPEYIAPQKRRRGGPYTKSKDYQYFYEHITPDIANKLPSKKVVCWFNDHILTLPVCASKKFWKEATHCKRCPLFQEDEHASTLRSAIEEWETDDLELED